MVKKKVFAVTLAAAMTFALGATAACGGEGDGGTPASSVYDMDITKQVTEWEKVTKNGVTYYQAEGVVYCANPTTKAKQCLNIYVPSEYMNDDGTVNLSGTRNGYTAATAPIMYINSVGAYQGKVPYKITDPSATLAMQEGWYFNYIDQGFVLAFAGARGRSDYENSTQLALGKAPVALADLKAGIRFLKHNDAAMAGDATRIVSNGMSAGGAMSILLGVSGNSAEFDAYLQEMGAVMDETDDVYAAQVYCPITDLEHADFAYEWYYSDDGSTYYNDLTDFQKALSANFAEEYVDYFNSLNITVDGTAYGIGADGRSGTFVDWLLEQYAISYSRSNAGAAPSWLSSIDGIVSNHKSRSKTCPAFDSLDVSSTATASSECGVFGRLGAKLTDPDFQRHFSLPVFEQIKALESLYPEEYAQYYPAYEAQCNLDDVRKQVELYNPYTYLDAGNTDVAEKIRICVGSQDSDTSPAITAQLTLRLLSLGVDTQYNIVWGLGHTDADYAGAYEEWVNGICK